jgi:hypothetical protein
MRGISVLNTVQRIMSLLAARDVVERAPRSARCDECVVIADETSSANLRWAGNTLTTNARARSRQLTVVAISRGRAAGGRGVLRRGADDQIERCAGSAGRGGGPAYRGRSAGHAGRGAWRPGAPGWDDPVDGTGISVFGASPRRSARCSAAAPMGGD